MYFRYDFETSQPQCVTSCKENEYTDRANKKCEPCHSTCQTCSKAASATSCTSCPDSYLFYKSKYQCMTTCPQGTIKEQNFCSDCATGCAVCTEAENETACTACLSNYFLFEKSCYTTCPKKYYGNPSTLVCQECFENCETCSGPGEQECLSCPGERILTKTSIKGSGSCIITSEKAQEIKENIEQVKDDISKNVYVETFYKYTLEIQSLSTSESEQDKYTELRKTLISSSSSLQINSQEDALNTVSGLAGLFTAKTSTSTQSTENNNSTTKTNSAKLSTDQLLPAIEAIENIAGSKYALTDEIMSTSVEVFNGVLEEQSSYIETKTIEESEDVKTEEDKLNKKTVETCEMQKKFEKSLNNLLTSYGKTMDEDKAVTMNSNKLKVSMMKTSVNKDLTTSKLNTLLNQQTTDNSTQDVQVNVPASFLSKIAGSGLDKIVVKKQVWFQSSNSYGLYSPAYAKMKAKENANSSEQSTQSQTENQTVISTESDENLIDINADYSVSTAVLNFDISNGSSMEEFKIDNLDEPITLDIPINTEISEKQNTHKQPVYWSTYKNRWSNFGVDINTNSASSNKISISVRHNSVFSVISIENKENFNEVNPALYATTIALSITIAFLSLYIIKSKMKFMEISNNPNNAQFKKNISVNYFASVLVSTNCWFNALTKSLIYFTYLMTIILFVSVYYIQDNLHSETNNLGFNGFIFFFGFIFPWITRYLIGAFRVFMPQSKLGKLITPLICLVLSAVFIGVSIGKIGDLNVEEKKDYAIMLVIIFCADTCLSLIIMIASLFLNFSQNKTLWTILKFNGFTELSLPENRVKIAKDPKYSEFSQNSPKKPLPNNQIQNDNVTILQAPEEEIKNQPQIEQKKRRNLNF
eukprot:TRINITY_DN1612_c0_g1_i12.p1 TRINITY_DN1612_c0_g1~~TRINITY_DN1612_c0_g1_i12.p1  ORF type:complete len:872 (-),score=179.84 TRINITY_DN1612_c0_g1_i12:298-2913(-)